MLQHIHSKLHVCKSGAQFWLACALDQSFCFSETVIASERVLKRGFEHGHHAHGHDRALKL
ncbi:hypothetical protein A6R73_06975 [Xanthomonas translucens pv. poae]|uniref:Uncharacterized protein n=1 Tax=Xanthomonas graminis pv. poae TaxID=227946 RepID=A0A199NXQ1_9XANT|nr:hypothetical protein A6R73_06975 [Xanthomonas translucens pv. poae]